MLYTCIYRGQYGRRPNTVDVARCPNHERGYGRRRRPHVHARFVVLIIIVITDARTHMG